MYIDGLYRDCSPRIIWYSDFLEKACEVNAQPSPLIIRGKFACVYYVS